MSNQLSDSLRAIPPATLTASALRRELSCRAMRHALHSPHELSYGATPSVIFREENGVHGNFHHASYASICCSEDWCRRLRKTYTAGRWIPRRHDRSRAELDCANSSDALLMNIFCHPGVLDSPALAALLGIERSLRPTFGCKPGIPLRNGKTDQTEVDMTIGSLLIEAKLTEGSFQTASLEKILRYKAVEEVFDLSELPRVSEPRSKPRFDPEPVQLLHDWPPPDMPSDFTAAPAKAPAIQSYQLIRGALAAWHTGRSFIVLCDARRADLVEHWYKVIRAVRPYDLRSRLGLLTWQEIAATLPLPMQAFLEQKYGIYAA